MFHFLNILLNCRKCLFVSKKLLVYDGQHSHEIEEFLHLAATHNIITLAFPAHLTHIVQPLNVGCFQLYKHTHNLAIRREICNLSHVYRCSAWVLLGSIQRVSGWVPRIQSSQGRYQGINCGYPNYPVLKCMIFCSLALF